MAQLSLHALSGHPASATLRITGTVNGHEVVILVYGGSTHNFVQDRMVRFLNLAAQSTPRLTFMVGNGSEIRCDQVCKNVPVLIQGHQFHLDLYVMALGGAGMVFGVAWLKLLGLVTTDYSHLTMSLVWKDQPITLQGCSGPGSTEVTHG